MNRPSDQHVLVVQPSSATAALVLETLARLGVRGTVVPQARSLAQKLCDGPCNVLLLEADDDAATVERLVSQVKADWPELPVLAVVGAAQATVAVRAMRAGCEDVLVGPLSAGAVESALGPLLATHPVQLAAQELGLSHIAGRSEPLRAALATARKVARTSMPVLISGESGTGKELLSYYLHRHSRRRGGPYIRVNCAALSETLLESELFGHERGAFTGAVALRKGRFERAHGGTLLLDEVSETGPRLQAQLLRVLEQQDFERVGGSETVRVNVRVVATSNRDLHREVEQGRFRRDLYYRISGINLVVPPLRERGDDLVDLVWYFVNLYSHESGRTIRQLDEGMLELFTQYAWPGNVRQLRNIVRSALSLGEGPVLSLRGAEALEHRLREQAFPSAGPAMSLEALERQAIFEALRRTKSHQAQAARILGISDRTLREKLRRYRQEGALAAAGENRW